MPFTITSTVGHAFFGETEILALIVMSMLNDTLDYERPRSPVFIIEGLAYSYAVELVPVSRYADMSP